MKSLVLYLILTGIVLNFAPNANYKRYIRFFSGLIVLVLLAEPIQFIFHLSSGDLDRFVAQIEQDFRTNSQNVSQDTMYNYYEMSVSEGIGQALKKQGIDVDKVEVLSDKQGGIVRCTVYIMQHCSDTEEERIKNIISDVYNLEMNRIYVVRR